MQREDFNVSETTYGTLDCLCVDALEGGANPSALAVICHGFGASGRDLVGLAPEWIAASPKIRGAMRFIFPAAPIVLGMGYGGDSRAWWHIDMSGLEAAMASGTPRIRRDELPEELATRNDEMRALLEELGAESGLGLERTILGGFSQGAMLTTEMTLTLPKAPLGQMIFSGTLLCEARWRSLASNLPALPILQSHGRQDPLLRFEEAEALRDLLREGGAEVEFVPFNGEHTIGEPAMNAAKRYLEARITTLV